MIRNQLSRIAPIMKEHKKPIILFGGIGGLTIAVLSMTLVSALAPHSSANADTAKTSTFQQPVAPSTPQTVQTTPQATEQTKATSVPTTSTPKTSTTTSPQSTTTSSAATEPVAPTPPTYADTYPSDWLSKCGGVDTWGMTTCQSTSYTAWKVNETFGNMPKWGFGSKGDAKYWPDNASIDNIPTGTTPKAHSVGVMNGTPGFTAWVEAVNSDGTIDISYYNFNTANVFGYKLSVPASSFSTYIYFS